MKLKDIAAVLSIPDSMVRKKKSLDNWDAYLKGSAPRRGADDPLGNKKAVATREYENIWLNALEDDELDLVNRLTRILSEYPGKAYASRHRRSW